MTKSEAKRRALSGIAELVDPRGGHDNEFLYTNDDGSDMSERDRDRMTNAAIEICDELRRRAKRRTP